MRTLLALLSLAALGCGNSPLDRTPDVRFEVRPFTTTKDEGEVGTSFDHKAPVLAIGDSSDARRPYLVVVRLIHVSGGDPEIWGDHKEVPLSIPVINGVGEIAVSGGFRMKASTYQKGDTWDPAQFRVEIVGYAPIITP